jgi:hypothetical protein
MTGGGFLDGGMLVLEPRAADVGALSVKRALPSPRRRMVGPFIFWDEMGPAMPAAGDGLDVRPHPHIGLATVTYLFDGEIRHRDSLGSDQRIRPGDVNLMVAGRGIVHSERTPPEGRDGTMRLHGIQSWIALPDGEEERAPSFAHTPAADLPRHVAEGAAATVVMGTAFGLTSPVECFSETLYLDVTLDPGGAIDVPDVPEAALYVVDGEVSVTGRAHPAGRMLIREAAGAMTVTATGHARVMVLGGAPVGPRHIWWNFVSSDPAAIERAKEDWRARRFDPVPDDDSFIPLPEV